MTRCAQREGKLARRSWLRVERCGRGGSVGRCRRVALLAAGHAAVSFRRSGAWGQAFGQGQTVAPGMVAHRVRSTGPFPGLSGRAKGQPGSTARIGLLVTWRGPCAACDLSGCVSELARLPRRARDLDQGDLRHASWEAGVWRGSRRGALLWCGWPDTALMALTLSGLVMRRSDDGGWWLILRKIGALRWPLSGGRGFPHKGI